MQFREIKEIVRRYKLYCQLDNTVICQFLYA
jgi:hypothetical protein